MPPFQPTLLSIQILIPKFTLQLILTLLISNPIQSLPTPGYFYNPIKTSYQQSTHKSIFILAGQSNMSGRGGVTNNTATGLNIWDGVIPLLGHPNINILRLDANLNWVVARDPLHVDIDVNKTCGVGPGMTMAHTVLGRMGKVGLVPCAAGGTMISEWEKGTMLYERMVNRAKAAVVKSGGGRIEAVIWFQGETDTKDRVDAELYGGRLIKMLIDLRSDLENPMLPIIVVAIASGEGPYVEIVRRAQLGINLLNVKIVDAIGLPLGLDNLHLTTAAQVHLGYKLGRAYLQFLPKRVQQKIVSSDGSSIFFQVYYPSGTFWRLFFFSVLFILALLT